MQKKLIALAIAGLSGAAFAQSNVTIYGVMDATFDNVKADSATAPAGGTSTGLNLQGRSRVAFDSSYIGFKGTEALGNGLAVAWQIESAIYDNPTGSTATDPARANTYGWANRDTYVGLAGGFGTVAFGNITGPTRALGAAMDVNAGATGIGANTALLGKLGGGSGAGIFDQRIAGAIAYISPNFNGFSGVLGYAPNAGRGFDTSTNPVTGAAPLDVSAWTLGLTYNNGPIYVSYAYTEIKDSNGGSNVNTPLLYGNTTLNRLQTPALAGPVAATATVPVEKTNDNRLGVKYDFGSGTVGLLWDRMKADLGGTPAAALGSATQTVWYIPVTFNVGSGKIIAQYGKAKSIDWSGTVATLASAAAFSPFSDTSAKHYEIGYSYDLSKRTSLKALYSRIKNGSGASNDFLFGVNNMQSSGMAGTVQPGATVSGVSFGMRHNF